MTDSGQYERGRRTRDAPLILNPILGRAMVQKAPGQSRHKVITHFWKVDHAIPEKILAASSFSMDSRLIWPPRCQGNSFGVHQSQVPRTEDPFDYPLTDARTEEPVRAVLDRMTSTMRTCNMIQPDLTIRLHLSPRWHADVGQAGVRPLIRWVRGRRRHRLQDMI